MERLYIVDGHGYLFRAHFGLMNSSRGEKKEVRLSTAEGMPTGALYVFSRMLLRLHEDVKPERICVVFDAGRRTFRNEIYADYKAHRPPAPEDLQIQMPYFRPIVDAMRWPVLAIEGVEADDVIATLACRARERGWEVVIYSADKDLTQLTGNGVSMIDALHQKTYTREEVEKKYGVPPEQVADYLALIGDTTDNIPGVPGVGGKTAAKLLADHGSVEGIIAANPVIPRLKVKQPFSDPEQVERLRLSRRLVELERNVPLPVELDDLRARTFDTPKLVQMFKELEFQLLVDKLDAGPPVVEDVPVLASDDGLPAVLAEPTIVTSADDIAALAAAARESRLLSLIVEHDGARPDRAHVIGLAVAVPGRAPAYVPLGHRYIGAPEVPSPEALAPLVAVLADEEIAKICHDSKTAIRLLGDRGIALTGIEDDTMLASFLLDSTRDAAAAEVVLAPVARATLAPRAELAGKNKHNLESVPVERAAAWVGRVAEVALKAQPELRRQLQRTALEDLYRDVELPVARILVDLERVGIAIDPDHFRMLGDEVGQQIADLERKVFELVGHELNLGSPKQLAHVLFDELGLTSDKMKKTKTGQSVDAEVLESLVDAHPAIASILEHRELVKLKGTYLDALPPLVNPKTGRVHTSFNQVVAATGRISSQDPNLQNIPIRSEIGREIRRGFVAGPGKVLVAADYSQIELRIIAHLSGDPTLVRAFKERIDIHTQTAAEVFSVGLDAVTAEMRRVAKAVNYGLAYGQSDFGLARALDIPRKEAKEYSERYFERFPTIHAFMDSVVADARQKGGASTLMGRWRPIPDIKSKSPMARRQAERIAQNMPMQGAGADIIKVAMIRTTERIARDGLDASMLLTVHDELVFEVAPEKADALAAAVKEEMEAAYTLEVPLDVDVGIARSWADA
jgi:DNA polymerase-1